MATDRQKLGARGEEIAETHLAARGYALLARNYRCAYGEIDRIMRDGDTLVFVEVKTRRGVGFGPPAESVNAPKRRQITRAALHYLQEADSPEEPDCRFDVVGVLLADGAPPQVEHHRGVFTVESWE
ncbi:MAG: YraN family protein [Armatimonadetes bacterium]|nr:YraN family protein [Armatimonadota bacterium]